MPLDVQRFIPYIWSILFGSQRGPTKSPSGITIAFIGRSGSGMSQLIHDATGSYTTGVAPDNWRDQHLDEPYTDHIQYSGYTVPGIDHADFPLFFIDTPGFSFSSKNNAHSALRKLRAWLKRFKPRIKLDGLIFMHDVSIDELRNRPPFVPRSNVLEKICGPDWARKVIFVSSHWDQITSEEAALKEAQVQAYWSYMRSLKGAPVLKKRYELTGSSAFAWDILRPLVQGALASRKEGLENELNSLKDLIKDDVQARINELVSQKMNFLEKLTLALGQNGLTLTGQERKEYMELNKRAHELWTEVENELGIVELERLLTAGLANSDQIKKITIAVVGSVRSGKTRFIYDATGQRKEHIASEAVLHPHTKDYSTAWCLIPALDISSQLDCLVTLIDTPGFDYLDSSNNEKERFAEVLKWKTQRYGMRAELHGVIYLHSIHNNELETRNSFFNYSQPLKQVWSDDLLRHIVFVSSFWSDDYQDSEGKKMTIEDMEGREGRVKDSYWNITKVKMMRYGNSGKEAKEILKDALLSFL